ncbi:MAG TPA: hypothetical protein VMA54_22805 [Steroidobacteraceae bacterium]|nr:hypothetical protein [Steroidobacteraceae bacterium]
MNDRKPWRPRIKDEPMLNPFESSTDWTRDLGANDRIEIPDVEIDPEEDRPDAAQKPDATRKSPK